MEKASGAIWMDNVVLKIQIGEDGVSSFASLMTQGFFSVIVIEHG